MSPPPSSAPPGSPPLPSSPPPGSSPPAATPPDSGRRSPDPGRRSPSPIPFTRRPARPLVPPPLTAQEIADAKLELERLREKQAADKVLQEKKRKAEERRKQEEAARARAEAERVAEEERKAREELERQQELMIQLDREGKSNRPLPPPPPPTDPPRWAALSQDTLLVPRGRLVFEVRRVTGVGGAQTGGAGGSQSGTGAGMFSMFATKKSGAGAAAGTEEEGSGTGTGTSGGGRPGAPRRDRIRDMYVRLELHLGGDNVFSARTHTYKNRAMSDFMLLGAAVQFRLSAGVVQPTIDDKLPMAQKLALPPILFYSVWSKGRVGDVLLAEGQLPAGHFFVPNPEGSLRDVCLPLLAPGSGARAPNCRYANGSLQAWMACAFRFVPSCAGILAISVHEGRALQQVTLGRMDPTPLVTLAEGAGRVALGPEVAGAVPVAELKTQGTMCKEGGTDPMFNHEELLLWVDHEHCVAGSELKVSLFTENGVGAAMELGAVRLPINDWVGTPASVEEHLTLRKPGGGEAGKLLLTRQFFPAGTLTVRVNAGHNIAAGDLMGGCDAFVKLRLEGRMRSYAVKTRVLPNAGSNPLFDETFLFDVVDHSDLHVSLWDFDKFTEDDLVGEVLVDLGGVYRHGVRDAAVPLKISNAWGNLGDAGLLTLETDFVGPPDVAYPMMRVGKDTFTDEERTNRRARDAAELAAERKAKQEEERMSDEQKKLAAFAAEALQGTAKVRVRARARPPLPSFARSSSRHCPALSRPSGLLPHPP